jgi:hypothetical protein
MEYEVKYTVEFYNSEMVVNKTSKHEMEILAVDFAKDSVRLRVEGASIVTSCGPMVAFADDTKGKLRELLRKIDQVEEQGLKGGYECDFEGLRVRLHALTDADEMFKQLFRVVREMVPLVRVGQAIYAQLRATPLRSSTAVEFYLPAEMTEECPTGQWLEERRQAGQAIDIETAEIASASRSKFDPYEVYRKLPRRHRYDRCHQYFF